MKKEEKQQWVELSKFIFIIGFALLYAYGGLEGYGKYLRRFIAPVFLSIGLYIYSRDWRVFIQAPLMMVTLCLGYGADTLTTKLLRRSFFGITNGASSAFYIIVSNKRPLLLFLYQVIFILSLHIVIGIWNPLSSARAEELVLGFCLAFFPMMNTKKIQKEN